MANRHALGVRIGCGVVSVKPEEAEACAKELVAQFLGSVPREPTGNKLLDNVSASSDSLRVAITRIP